MEGLRITSLEEALSKPYEATIKAGIVFTLQPVTATDYASAAAYADGILDDVQLSIGKLAKAGILMKEDVDINLPHVRAALRRKLIAKYLAPLHIRGWRGVLPEEGAVPLPLTPENIAGALEYPDIFEAFYWEALHGLAELAKAKKGHGAAPAG